MFDTKIAIVVCQDLATWTSKHQLDFQAPDGLIEAARLGPGRVKTRGLGLLRSGDVAVSQEWAVHRVERVLTVG